MRTWLRCPYHDQVLRFFLRVIVHAEWIDTKLPRCHRVWAHGLTVSGFHLGFVHQLLLNGVENGRSLSGCQRAQVLFGVRRIFDSLRQRRYLSNRLALLDTPGDPACRIGDVAPCAFVIGCRYARNRRTRDSKSRATQTKPAQGRLHAPSSPSGLRLGSRRLEPPGRRRRAQTISSQAPGATRRTVRPVRSSSPSPRAPACATS